MFLALTNDRHFWNANDDIVYLGEWCFDFPESVDVCASDAYHLLGNPWETNHELENAINIVDAFTERLFKELTTYLNDSLGVQYNERAWRIIVYPWLQRAVHSSYDRYWRLKSAIETFPDIKTLLLEKVEYVTPRDYNHYKALIDTSHYNMQLYSQAADALGLISPRVGIFKGTALRALYQKLARFYKELGRRRGKRRSVSSSGMSGNPGPTGNPDFLTDTLLFYRTLPRHPDANRQILDSVDWATIDGPMVDIDLSEISAGAENSDSLRQGLGSLTAVKPFEEFFVSNLPMNFPWLYLEGFRAARDKVRSQTPPLPRVVVSSNHGWWGRESFKIFAAEAVAKGARTATVQSSGVHGLDRYMPQRNHETAIADSFVSWGWQDQRNKVYRSVPCPYTSLLREKREDRENATGDKLLYLQAWPVDSYTRWMGFSQFTGSRQAGYFHRQERFLSSLDPGMRSNVKMRIKSDRRNGNRFASFYKSRFSDIDLEFQSDLPIVESMGSPNNRLLIMDHCTTGILEGLALNIPILMFWDDEMFLMADRAKCLFEPLKEHGVLCDTPERAARQLEAVYNSSEDWWGQADIQEARRKIVAEFARTADDWVQQWISVINQEIREASHDRD